MTITIPEPLSDFVESQVAKGHYPSAEHCVLALVAKARDIAEGVHPDQRRMQEMLGVTHEEIVGLIQEAIDSGPSAPMTDEDWEEIRREGLKRLSARATA